jgi:sugar lactone lactonase YvrE
MPLPATRLIVACLALTMAALLAPASASAEAYTHRAETCGSARGHGSNDLNGVMYAACGRTIVRFDAANRRLPNITVDNLTFNSVATSPRGRFLYAATGGRLVRLDRQADGTYQRNPTWAPKEYHLNHVAYKPVPRNVVTDEFGNIYISNNGTDPETRRIAPSRILKYAPNGTIMTAFGEHNNEPGNPYAFFQNRGLSVSRDGRILYVTSHLQGQIRRFDLQPNGQYRYHSTIGRLDTNCTSNEGLSAVSDVAVDPWGFVYAADTTCRRIKKFRPDGTYLATIATNGPKVLHEIGVNRRGDVFAGEWDRLYLRAASNPVPGPIPTITRPVIDTTAPTLTRVELPARVTDRDVQLHATATDNVGITHARVANEDGNWGPWRAWSNPLAHTLTAGLSYKVVYLQVRDAAGNESGVVHAVSQLVAANAPPPPVADTVAPTLTRLTLPATTTARDIQVTLEATDDVGITHVRFANEDGNWQAWKAWSNPATHTVTAGLTFKVVYAQVRDAAGNESTVRFATTRLVEGAADQPPPAPGPVDTVAPTLTAITLPATTTVRTITVTITAADDVRVTQMRLANEDGNWGPWVAFDANATHTLSAGYSIKGVYVQVRDAAGNESGTLYRTLRFQA